MEPPLALQHNVSPDLAQLKQEFGEELLKEMYSANAMQAQPTHHTSVFNEAMIVVLFPNNFKMPNIPHTMAEETLQRM